MQVREIHHQKIKDNSNIFHQHYTEITSFCEQMPRKSLQNIWAEPLTQPRFASEVSTRTNRHPKTSKEMGLVWNPQGLWHPCGT